MNFDRSKWGFSPSLICMGYLSIEKKISLLEKEFNSFHVDIMNGHFCHSIHLSPDYIKDIFSITKLPIVVHLMVENPFDYIQQLIENGAGTIIVHIESCQTNIFRIIDAVHKAKKKLV